MFLFFIFKDPFHGLLLTDGRSPFPCLLFIEQTYGSVNINILFKVKFWLTFLHSYLYHNMLIESFSALYFF